MVNQPVKAIWKFRENISSIEKSFQCCFMHFFDEEMSAWQQPLFASLHYFSSAVGLMAKLRPSLLPLSPQRKLV